MRVLSRVFLSGISVLFLCAVILSVSLFVYMKNIDPKIDEAIFSDSLGLTTKIYSTSGENGENTECARLHGSENRIYVELNKISDNLKKAFIAIEDHRFYKHKGVDLKRTAGAVLNFFGGKNYGGSTITQQLIKNVTGENKVTVKRKLTEIMRAIELEKNMEKDKILELYLNNVYLSSGCFGVETAAERYFGKSAAELTIAESASIAAIVQNPSAYDPSKKPENNKKRRDTVLFRMNELGFIDNEEYENAISEEVTTTEYEKSEDENINSWFIDTLIEDVINDLVEKCGYSRSAASAKVYSGGLSIYSTINEDMQRMLDEYYADSSNFPGNADGTPDSAAVIIDGKTGAICAISGGRGQKTSNRAFNLATNAKRSPGSSLKPISVYAPAIEKNIITWATVFDDVPVSFTKTDSGYVAWPKNNPRVYNGLTTVNKAITNSVNTVAVRVLKKLSLPVSFDFCQKAGISTLYKSVKTGNGKTLTDMSEAPLALGATSIGVSVREMTGAYTMFTRNGEFEKPYTYTKVYDSDGKLLLSNGENAKRLISEDTADIMRKLLKNVVSNGTAKGLSLASKVEVAGKTGTSNSGADRWFIGLTPDFVCGVWCGYRDGRDIGYFKTNPACNIFDGIMGNVYDSISDYERKFEESDNVIALPYCVDSGELPSKACLGDPRGHRIETGYFKKGTEPKDTCDTHISVLYDKVTHAVACDKCPKENLTRISLIKVYDRSFPIDVKITDAQYTYRYLPIGIAPSLIPGTPFFANLAGSGEYFGSSGKNSPLNRFCREHYLEENKIKEKENSEKPPATKEDSAAQPSTKESVSTTPPTKKSAENKTTTQNKVTPFPDE